MLKSLKLDEAYKGVEEVTAEMYEVEDNDEGPRPFRCFLDIGLQRASCGARIFGVLKGAVDGGLAVPHNEKRFPGYDNDAKEYDAEFHQSMIFGTHVSDYMEHLLEQDEDRYKSQFARYIASEIEADDIKEMIEATHAAIRANPDRKPKT